MGATQSPGGGNLRQGVLRKELTWQVGGTTGRPACLRRVRGDVEELVSEQWPGDRKWHGSLGWSRAEEGCGLISNLRDFYDGHWRGDSRSNSRS